MNGEMFLFESKLYYIWIFFEGATSTYAQYIIISIIITSHNYTRAQEEALSNTALY